MTDRKKVIKGLKFCSTGMCFDGCPYHEVSQNIDKCTSQLALEALELLKEQEQRIDDLESEIKLMKMDVL